MPSPISIGSARSLGQEIGTSDWVVVSQERINAFADATGDHQWIHVDPERAAVESPFGTTIAHGFLTLSLVSALMRNALSIGGLRMAINYGANRVRFVSPVPAGARIRARIVLASVDEVADATQALWHVTVEREDATSRASSRSGWSGITRMASH